MTSTPLSSDIKSVNLSTARGLTVKIIDATIALAVVDIIIFFGFFKYIKESKTIPNAAKTKAFEGSMPFCVELDKQRQM